MMHSEPHPILEKIEATCRKFGFGLSEFGLISVKDGSLVSQLREGRDPRRATISKIEAAIGKIEDGKLQPKSLGTR